MDPATRSRLMSRIGPKNTKPEVALRKALFALGYRYRLHRRDLPGKPDIVLPKYRAVILVHGCFWHGHDCHLFRLPSTRTEFWTRKIEGNRERDRKNVDRLRSDNWRVLEVWECAMRGPAQWSLSDLAESVAVWLTSGASSGIRRGEESTGKRAVSKDSVS